MLTLTPSSVPMDIVHVREVLALAADPEATKSRLEELEKALDEANAALTALAAERADVDAKVAAHQVEADNLAVSRAAFEEFNRARTAELAGNDETLTARVRAFDEREARGLASLAAREQDVGHREAAAERRESALSEAENKVAAIHNDLDRRLSLIRSAAG